jgi:hypothetical protein
MTTDSTHTEHVQSYSPQQTLAFERRAGTRQRPSTQLRTPRAQVEGAVIKHCRLARRSLEDLRRSLARGLGRRF